MIIAIVLVTVNIVVLGMLNLAYLILGRRRWKIYLLVEHLATLAQNGLPIHAGLRAVGRDLGGYLGLKVARVAHALEEGRSMSEAFQAVPGTFPPLLRSMLALGEKSGNLAGFLQEMRRSYRRIADLPFQSLYIFLYPLVLSIGINLALASLYAGIIPTFFGIMQQGRVGEAGHRIMAWWPRLITANEILLLLCVVMVMFLVVGGVSLHFGSSFLRILKRALDRAVLAAPILGGLARDGAIQQFALCSGLFLRSGAGLPEALSAGAAVERNGVLRRRLERLAARVGEGSRFSAAVREEGGFGDDFLWFVDTGETSGMLADHLVLASIHYESKVRLAARLASRGVVPFFVLANGAIVLGTFLLLFLPIQEILKAAIERRP